MITNQLLELLNEITLSESKDSKLKAVYLYLDRIEKVYMDDIERLDHLDDFLSSDIPIKNFNTADYISNNKARVRSGVDGRRRTPFPPPLSIEEPKSKKKQRAKLFQGYEKKIKGITDRNALIQIRREFLQQLRNLDNMK